MIRAIVTLGPAALLAAGCTTAMADDGPMQPAPVAQCNAEGVQGAVGSVATQQLGTQLVERSGATRFRWGPPGAIFTQDYRQDRLNVTYDESSRITRIYCG